jgi:hypothetical protein
MIVLGERHNGPFPDEAEKRDDGFPF